MTPKHGPSLFAFDTQEKKEEVTKHDKMKNKLKNELLKVLNRQKANQEHIEMSESKQDSSA